ncbi:MAG: hypothetical protein HC794_02625 [Nitrospiraceae bacterium]|nr:hypothetical protein [Nitrospiraceae bacterium]
MSGHLGDDGRRFQLGEHFARKLTGILDGLVEVAGLVRIKVRKQPAKLEHVAEGRALSKKNPPGSSWIEKVDCSKHAAKIVIR